MRHVQGSRRDLRQHLVLLACTPGADQKDFNFCQISVIGSSGFTPTIDMADKIDAALEKAKETIETNAGKISEAAGKFGAEAKQAGETSLNIQV